MRQRAQPRRRPRGAARANSLEIPALQASSFPPPRGRGARRASFAQRAEGERRPSGSPLRPTPGDPRSMFQIVLSLIAAIAAIAVGVGLYRRVIAAPTSTDRANEIAAAIRSGAEAFLSRQYRTVAKVGRADPARGRAVPGLVVRVRLPGRRARERGGRLHRHERVGARERARRGGGQDRLRPRVPARLPGRRGDRPHGGGRGSAVAGAARALHAISRATTSPTRWSASPSAAR